MNPSVFSSVHACYHPVTALLHVLLRKTVTLLCCDRCYTCYHPLYVCIENVLRCKLLLSVSV